MYGGPTALPPPIHTYQGTSRALGTDGSCSTFDLGSLRLSADDRLLPEQIRTIYTDLGMLSRGAFASVVGLDPDIFSPRRSSSFRRKPEFRIHERWRKPISSFQRTLESSFIRGAPSWTLTFVRVTIVDGNIQHSNRKIPPPAFASGMKEGWSGTSQGRQL
jgi:hypothetical protein